MRPASSEIFGAEIQYFRLDPRYWEEVLQRFLDTGLRCVTTYVQWSTHLVGPPDAEHPAGIIDFEGRTDPRLNVHRFLDLVEQAGLILNFRCGPFCCNEMVHGGYPPWLVLGDPDMMVWDWQNRTTQGYWIGKREGSQPSYLHPTYLEWCKKWFAEVDRVIVPHLQVNGGCVAMLNLDNEISYIIQDGFLSSDYNPVNVKPGGYYHQFLTEKYGSADRLSYPVKYAGIEDVPAPRTVPPSIAEDLAYYTDWCEFKTWVMCEYIKRLRAMHEANGVHGVTFMTNFNPHRPEGIPTRMPAFEAATGGIVGYDFYRGTFMSYSGYHSMARVLKLMNASLGYTWSAEFMAGTWEKVLSSRVSDDHMRFMARCALSHGCKAIDWFMFHDRDCWGDSPVSSHGHARPSLAVLTETATLTRDTIPTWDSLEPQGDVAIIYDMIQHQHTYLGDPCPCADGELHIGSPTIDGMEAGLASREYEGIFRLVEQAGYQAHVVDLQHDSSQLKRYPLVFLPGAPVFSEDGSEALRKYVEQGGTLVVSGPWPNRTAQGIVTPFLGITAPDDAETIIDLPLGQGRVIWRREYLAQTEPEQDSLDSIAHVADWLGRFVGTPHVLLSVPAEISWVDWQSSGGHRRYEQPRLLGTAILHTGPSDAILFVLNHYPEAAVFNIALRDTTASHLLNLDTGTIVPLDAGKASVDIDRKSAAIYRVVQV